MDGKYVALRDHMHAWNLLDLCITICVTWVLEQWVWHIMNMQHLWSAGSLYIYSKCDVFWTRPVYHIFTDILLNTCTEGLAWLCMCCAVHGWDICLRFVWHKSGSPSSVEQFITNIYSLIGFHCHQKSSKVIWACSNDTAWYWFKASVFCKLWMCSVTAVALFLPWKFWF